MTSRRPFEFQTSGAGFVSHRDIAERQSSFHDGRVEETNFLLCHRPDTVAPIRMRFEPCKVRLPVWNWGTLRRLLFLGDMTESPCWL
jgi:hypothetical protein